MFWCGVLPGLSRLKPSSSGLSAAMASDQLQCLPEPLMPANGFSCRSAWRPWRSATRPQHRHRHLVVVDGDVRLLEHRRHLELRRRDFVVPRHDRHAELVQLVLRLGDARLDALRDAAEVVVLELLAARRRRADERAARHHEVGAQREVAAVDEEVFLLGSERGVDALHALVAEQLEQLDRLGGERIGAAEQRRHLVERLTVVADEDRRDAERARAARLDDEHRARRVPRRVAAGLPRGAQAAGGEARRVGLALDELRAGERLERLAVVVEVEEGVVLLGRQPGLRLEPVREVRHAAADRPLLDDLRDRGRDLEVELLSVPDGRGELRVDVLAAACRASGARRRC